MGRTTTVREMGFADWNIPQSPMIATLVIASTRKQYEIVVEEEELEPSATRFVSQPEDLDGYSPHGDIYVFVAEPVLHGRPQEFYDLVTDICLRGFRFEFVKT